MNLCVEDSISICILITGVSNSITIGIFLTRVWHSETIILKEKGLVIKVDDKKVKPK